MILYELLTHLLYNISRYINIPPHVKAGQISMIRKRLRKMEDDEGGEVDDDDVGSEALNEEGNVDDNDEQVDE